MNRIKAFISYSSKEKVVGGKFKTYIENYCGYEVFIAHDDIPGSSVWEDEIISAIEKSDIFIALISEAFTFSPFTDQETGIAFWLKKKIIPTKLDSTNPYGFISKYQALQYRRNPPDYYYKDNINKLAVSIAQIGMSYDLDSDFHEKAINSIVYAFCNSTSFNISNAVISSLIKCNKFSKQHISLILNAIKTNLQAKGAYDLSILKEFLLDEYKISVD